MIRDPLQVPKHIVELYGTARNFKQQKRTQLQRARRAIADLRFGCAYFPHGSVLVQRASQSLGILSDDLSQKRWGR